MKTCHWLHFGNNASSAVLNEREDFPMIFDSTLHLRIQAHLAPPGRVAEFWAPLGHSVWFGKDPAFDQRFREAFAVQHAAATRGELMPWLSSADGALSLVILLDQYPRNAFRGTKRMYASDALARIVANAALDLGYDRDFGPDLRGFFYLPFAHSELPTDQDRSVDLCADLPEPGPSHSRGHRDTILRFGRFPHRNAILGRETTAEEAAWLAAGGFAG
jgi:uncharacterized protein (DUF924 family)